MFWWWLSAIFVAVCWYFVKHCYSYWARKGFAYIAPSIPLGCLNDVVSEKKFMGEVLRDIHLASHEPYVGIYLTFCPTLLIRDPVLVKRVLTSDFEYFHDRGVYYDEENEPISANLFSMPGQKWHRMRKRLTPTFTTGKLKNMFNPIKENNQLFKDYLLELTESGDTKVRIKPEIVKLNLSIIASIFFGFEFNAFAEPHHEFTQIGELFLETKTLRSKLVAPSFFLFPRVMKLLRVPLCTPQVSQYVMNLVRNVIRQRESEPSSIRNDFIQTVLEMATDKNSDMTVEKISAQVHLFYTAGFETSASVSSFCIYELSKSPEWMGKARAEVDELMRKCNGEIQYQDVLELKTLDMCIKEAMRMYPPVAWLNRECTKDYQIPETNQVIPQGTPVIISILGLQTDEQNFPKPNVFDPTRFENHTSIEGDWAYYPLGAGPRFCIGARLGLIMVRMVLCTLIHNFELEAVDSTIQFKATGPFLMDRNNIHLKIKRRNVKID